MSMEDEYTTETMDGAERAGEGWLDRVRRAIKSPRVQPFPETVFNTARAAFLERQRNPDRTIHVARLLFDSWTHMPAPALRMVGTREICRAYGTAETRHQIYSTAWHDVDLWGERQSGELWYLIGQILPREEGAAIKPLQAVLSSSDKTVATGVPEDGEFHIPSVRAGLYDLRLRLERAEVLIPNVRVGI